MNIEQLTEIWEKHDKEFLKFERVDNKQSNRSDLHAFLLLDKLIPNQGMDMVSSAEHDEIWLGVDTEKLEQVINEEQIVELIRCGVRFDTECESLAMFV